MRTDSLVLPNRDLDSGNVTKAAEYSLTDDTYAKLLAQLSERKFDRTSPELRDNILQFYSDLSLPIETKKDQVRWQGVLTSLDQLKLVTPNATVADSPAPHSLSVPTTKVVNTMPPVIVIGFVGGFIKHDNLVHSEVQLAARLRKAYPLGVDVETFEGSRGEEARKRILDLLDTNHDGTLTAEEKQNAHIIIYGHSWGGSEAIALARELEKDGIPVRLTIQVDSIAKIHQNDAVDPRECSSGRQFLSADMVFSTASPRFALPIQHVRVSSGIIDSTTKGALTTAANIPGTTASSSRPTPRLNVIQPCGNRWRL